MQLSQHATIQFFLFYHYVPGEDKDSLKFGNWVSKSPVAAELGRDVLIFMCLLNL